MSAKAYVTEYDDPGPTFAEWSHGDIGKVFDALLRDLGAKDCVREVKLIEMLLGDDTKAHLDDMIAGEFGPLSKVIDESRRILSDLFDMVLVRLILIPPFPH